ncbi:hypothetical protein [Lacipirellula parvula]|uniref:Nucleoside phosphorylase domain-containing protein n=1 Tax=Lacipirellula parvula TaxID=2650471 RepID=A0A5K7X9Q9_9BACT|nr:hypothetical protein [Lacipirellula parvula]BBO32592.1 hypothetical protein PLANPX_2204 [Lacipirellula parvula]
MLEFSAILSAVKPKQRTDQYLILSALYFLGANEAPVTVREISTLLRLHLQQSGPANISASLKAYTGLVEISGNETPRRWKLTLKGVERLRKLSGLELNTASRQSEYDTDIAFLCALEHPELSALIEAFGATSTWNEVGEARFSHVYRATTLTTLNGKPLSVVATASTSMGLTAAAIATTQLVFQFRPRIVVMVGIAAGTKNGGKAFGDILVADPSVDYNSGKVVFENGVRDFLPDPYPIGLNARLRSLIQKYRAPNSLLEDIRSKWKHSTVPASNRVHLGPVGAADQVIDDESRILEIQKNWRKLVGVEMETYGVYRACHEAPEPKPRFVSFKAVCDFAAAKTDSWQPYAAFMAANFAVEFLRVEWENIWPSA